MKVGIIGAGPAGLAAGAILSELSDVEVLLFDRGKHHQDRDHEDASDLGIGIGGAGLFSDGKFSFFPSGTEVYKLKDKQMIQDGHDWVCRKLTDVGIESFGIDGLKSTESNTDFLVKDYPSSYGSLEQRKKLIENLSNSKKCTFYLNSKVVQLSKQSGKYVVQFFDEKTGKEDSVIVDAIVLATGRFGNLAVPKLMSSFNFNKQKLRYEIGIRVETKSDMGFLTRRKNPDVKAIWKTPFGEVRTFCTCRNGEVWNIPYGDLAAVSGRSDGPKTGYSNFGLLIRFNGNEFDKGEEHFQRIMNSALIKTGGVAWQSLDSFLGTAEHSTNNGEVKSDTRP